VEFQRTPSPAINAGRYFTLLVHRHWSIECTRLYWEGVGNTIRENGFFASSRASSAPIDLPMGATIFPGETFLAPRSWPEAAWPNLFYWDEVDKGGHFAASSSRKSSQRKSGKPSKRFAAKLMAARDLRWANDYPPIAIACI
jgi:hypothetical protein